MKTLDEQIACVKREIALRERVYPRRILDGKMDGRLAEHEIACMKAVLESLSRLEIRLL